MSLPTIPTLPTAPDRSTMSAAEFSAAADAWLAAIAAWTTAVNAYGAALYAEAQSVISGVASVNGETGALTGYVKTSGAQTLSDKTLAAPLLDGALREEQAQIAGTTPAISPADGTVRYWTLTANSTPTKGTWYDGESITLLVADGPAAAVNWTSMAITWAGGSAPALPTSGWAVIELWQVNGVLYGAYAGAVA